MFKLFALAAPAVLGLEIKMIGKNEAIPAGYRIMTVDDYLHNE